MGLNVTELPNPRMLVILLTVTHMSTTDLSCNSGLTGEYAMECTEYQLQDRSADNSLTDHICHDLRGGVDYENVRQLYRL